MGEGLIAHEGGHHRERDPTHREGLERHLDPGGGDLEGGLSALEQRLLVLDRHGGCATGRDGAEAPGAGWGAAARDGDRLGRGRTW